MFGEEARLAIEEGKTGLMTRGVLPLDGVAIRYPHCGCTTCHRVAHDLGGAAAVGGMDNVIGREAHLLGGVASFKPCVGLVAGNNLCTA